MCNLKLISVVFLGLLLAGCAFQPHQQPHSTGNRPEDNTTARQQTAQPSVSETETPTPIPEPPKLNDIDWNASLSPLLEQMNHVIRVEQGSVLLVDNVKNSTNGTLQTGNATSTLRSQLAGNHQFTLVSDQQLSQARMALGLREEDSLRSRGKALALARNVGAQYLLYTTVRGEIKSAHLQMQLLQVQTGEIAWSGQGNAEYQ